MRTKSLFLILLFTSIGCGIFSDTDNRVDPALFGVWYTDDTSNTQGSLPINSIQGWNITSVSAGSVSSAGAFHPVGIRTDEGTIALLSTPYIPGIHYIDHEMIILDHFSHPEIIRDTLKYHINGDQLTLDGRFYHGTFQRTSIGTQVREPLISHLAVSINGTESENIQVTQYSPSAYISLTSSNDLEISATMNGQQLTLSIPGFRGTGTYIIGKHQEVYYKFGSDWLTPPYITHSDSSGTITFEYFDEVNNRYSGHFEFSATGDGEPDENPDNLKNFTGGVFDLPVFDIPLPEQ